MRLKLNLAFALNGIATTILGPLMPLLQSRWHLGDADGGLLFTVQFMASILGSIAVGPIGRRIGLLRAAAFGFALIALGTGGYPFCGWPAALGLAFVVGFGIGIVIPAGNMALSHDAKGVLWINFCWCAGAMIVPVIAAWAGGASFWWVTGASVVAAIALALEPGARPQNTDSGSSHWTLSRAARFASVSLFLYVAVEASLGGWIASLVKRNPDASSYWAAATSILWLGLLIGRAFVNSLLARFTPTALIWRGLILSLAGTAALVLAQSGLLTLAAGFVCGLGLAPLYPMIVAEYAQREEKGIPLSGLVFACGNVGGSLGPYVTGAISQATGSLRLGVAIAIPAIAAMLWTRKGLGAAKL